MQALLKTYSQRENLEPLRELSRSDLEYVFENAEVKPLDPHTLITPDDQFITYLLEGQISMLSGGFLVEQFNHNERRGLKPLFDEDRDEDSALLTSHGAILEVNRKLFEGLYSQYQSRLAELSGGDLAQQEQRLFEELHRAFLNDQLQLPALPEVALKLRRVINQAEVGSDEIIQLVQTDPILSARLIKVANSPLYGTWREIKTVREAVRRLGLETTRSLSFGLSMKQLFHARSELVKQQITQVYDESIQISALAYVITRNRADHLDPEQALLAGLLHKLGVLPILKYVDENPSLISTGQALSKSLIDLNVPVSQLMFDRWNFDPMFLQIVESCSDWKRDSGQATDYVDIIIAARLLYLQNSNQLDETLDAEQLPVAEKLGLFEEDDDGLDFYTQARHEIEEMQQMLRS